MALVAAYKGIYVTALELRQTQVRVTLIIQEANSHSNGPLPFNFQWPWHGTRAYLY